MHVGYNALVDELSRTLTRRGDHILPPTRSSTHLYATCRVHLCLLSATRVIPTVDDETGPRPTYPSMQQTAVLIHASRITTLPSRKAHSKSRTPLPTWRRATRRRPVKIRRELVLGMPLTRATLTRTTATTVSARESTGTLGRTHWTA